MYSRWPRFYDRDRDELRWKREERRDSIRSWLQDLKSNLSCMNCGKYKGHPSVLDFHHRDMAEKGFTVARAVRDGYSKERILEEISKCIVLCASCHRIRHEKDGIINLRNQRPPME